MLLKKKIVTGVTKAIVIGDVHGHFKTLQALLTKLPSDTKIVITGDLIDRGPDSAKVVAFVKKGVEEGLIECVEGNHEDMMVQEALHPSIDGIWIANGGLACIESYKQEYKAPGYHLTAHRVNHELIKEHVEWMKTLPTVIEFSDCKNEEDRCLVVSHSSICGAEKWFTGNPDKYRDSVIWGRGEPWDVPGIYNIFGHTPQADGATVSNFCANVDTGCFHKKPGYGKLTAMSFPGMEFWQQENID